MDVNLGCGCGATFEISEVEEENVERVFYFMERFASGHEECGYMTNGVSQEAREPVKVCRQRHPTFRIMDDLAEDDE